MPLLQLTLLMVNTLEIVSGSVTTNERESVQPFASSTVTVYVPADRVEMFAVVAPLLQAYVM